MALFKNVNGVDVEMTRAEETALRAEWAASDAEMEARKPDALAAQLAAEISAQRAAAERVAIKGDQDFAAAATDPAARARLIERVKAATRSDAAAVR